MHQCLSLRNLNAYAGREKQKTLTKNGPSSKRAMCETKQPRTVSLRGNSICYKGKKIGYKKQKRSNEGKKEMKREKIHERHLGKSPRRLANGIKRALCALRRLLFRTVRSDKGKPTLRRKRRANGGVGSTTRDLASKDISKNRG